MRIALVVGCCVLSAVWFRPWRVRPRPLVETMPQQRRFVPGSSSFATGSARGSAGQRVLLGVMIFGALVVGLMEPVFVIPLIFVYAVVVIRGRRASGDDDAIVVRTLPEVVDLLLVGVGAGLTPRETLQRCQAWLPEPFATAVQNALSRASSGATFAHALNRAMTPLGDRVRPLVAALNAGERDGSMLAGGLLRVSDEARRLRRVAAQERARRVPVAMLGPLLLCVLPSFALLTLVPLVLGSLSDLGVVI